MQALKRCVDVITLRLGSDFHPCVVCTRKKSITLCCAGSVLESRLYLWSENIFTLYNSAIMKYPFPCIHKDEETIPNISFTTQTSFKRLQSLWRTQALVLAFISQEQKPNFIRMKVNYVSACECLWGTDDLNCNLVFMFHSLSQISNVHQILCLFLLSLGTKTAVVVSTTAISGYRYACENRSNGISVRQSVTHDTVWNTRYCVFMDAFKCFIIDNRS